MENSIGRNRRLKAIRSDPVPWIALVRCAAGLAIVVLISAIGIHWPAVRPGTIQAHAATWLGSKEAQAHRKQVYDERRERWQGRGRRENIAEKPAVPADQLLLARPPQIAHWL